ncbi:MAG: phosphoglycerate mutase [Acidimicrobiales bacterium]|nr:MAG: phosphoglycerate mutase [Acidimicrobiales bacterium]
MLVLVRHGRTSANAAGLLLGSRGDDPPLDEIGLEQARRLGRSLGSAGLVVSSPLRRARETAAMIGAGFVVDDRWREIDYGEMEGTPLRDVPAEVWRRWRVDPGWAPPGGESLRSVYERVSAACEELVERCRSEDVVVVTHVSPLKAAVAWALGVGVEVSWRMWLPTGSVCRIATDGDAPRLLTFGEVVHTGR